MKKIIALTAFLFAITSFTQAQLKTKAEKKTTVPVKIVKTAPSDPVPPTPPPPAPAPTTKTGTDNQVVPVYTLSAVKVNIKTGPDNKEYPSEVRTTVGVRGSGMEYAYFVQENLKNEMRSNSNTEFGLEKRTVNGKDITLEYLQNAGIRLTINYRANFQLDAWKIEGVTVTLEFRDQNGNLHPTLAQKTITFSNANGFLNGYPGTTIMTCHTDGYFNPLSAFIQ